MSNLRFPSRSVSHQFYVIYTHLVHVFPFYPRGIKEEDEMLAESARVCVHRTRNYVYMYIL